MLMLARAVSRGARRPLLVADLPFGAYQVSNRVAVSNAIRFVREASADAVKIEGAGTTIRRAAAIVAAGVPVMGHLGLTPQTATMLGGYHPQGRTAASATRLLADAQALEAAGCFSIVLEAVPAEVAARVTDALRIPTIGIGSGASCDGQVLVWHDLLGLTSGHLPRFVKQYAQLSRSDRGGNPGLRRRRARGQVPGRRAHLPDVQRRAPGVPERDHRTVGYVMPSCSRYVE